MGRTYNDAITALNSLQSNYSIVQKIRKSGGRMNETALNEMVEWCEKIGYKPSDFNKLNLIHIAGTKGKGSTCAFISSILSQYTPASGRQTSQNSNLSPNYKVSKVGLYTSPHLRFVRERIQINNTPLSEEQFARYFFEIWDRLEDTARKAGMDPADPATKPIYFRYLTLMAWHAYLREGVDAAIIECGIGGEYDSTNILDSPIVTGITSLGIDHVELLGNSIEQIAWHKAGIMKPGSIAYTAPQPESALEVIRKRGKERGVDVHVATGHPDLKPGNIRLGLSGDFQYKNAELAVAVATSFLRARGAEGAPSYADKEPLAAPIIRGLENTRLGGRCEIRKETNITWHIDGGHTLDSIEATGRWFSSQPYTHSSPAGGHDKPQVLVFNQQSRDSSALAKALHDTLSAGNCSFTHAVFCTNITYKEAGYQPDLVSINTNATDVEKLSVQNTLAETWRNLSPNTTVVVKGTIEEAVQYVRSLASRQDDTVSALVTGSLHLVGGLIEVLETKTTQQ
ncbi:hypothetical protein UREG_02756 [Uncinocarpus reesii 1704]|uniref:Folylpolyglutamate synthase n=1 Tax=Uncinocarpus reesii (strain UAMH 1704) TaxID=336963 RepID=C4JHS0_UNCRE|nr:uncharacterized protein UREG_02756 [Uncinocarpus reesii 1704]EEP77907.1 hypothetical protein UREG_02756 [Uncinocarpus reesii 1704]